MYIYAPNDNGSNSSDLYIYEMKDGLLDDISHKIISVTNGHPAYAPQFLNLPQGLPNARSDQLWMIGGLKIDSIGSSDINEDNWTCQILNDKELKFDSSFIPKPTFENFPKGGFSQTIVHNNNNPVLYIIGGFVNSNETKGMLITNYFFKYEFNTNKWIDLSDLTKSILRPLAHHKVIVTDNSLIVVGGLSHTNTLEGNFTRIMPSSNIAYNRLNLVYKFDLSSERWDIIKPKVNLDAETYDKGDIISPSLNIYNNKIVSYMSLKNFITDDFDPKLAYLDYKLGTWEWEVYNVKNHEGTKNNLNLHHQQTLVINDQLIMFHGVSNQNTNNKVYAIDLKNNVFQDFINITGSYGKSTTTSTISNLSSVLPTWVVILISFICVVLVIVTIIAIWLYLRYKKQLKPDENNESRLTDVWAASDLESNGKRYADAALTNCSSGLSTANTNKAVKGDSIIGYDYFQHEVDTRDMDKTKSKMKYSVFFRSYFNKE